MRSWGVLACALGLLPAGCGVDAFSCEDDAMCDRSSGGRCELSGYCSFPDDACPSGYRFGEHAPAGLAMRCTEEEVGTDTSTSIADTLAPDTGLASETGADDGPGSDASTGAGSDGPSACAGWWDCAWAFRREIVVSGAVDAPLDDFPIPLALRDVSDPARFGPDGLDLRIVAEDGALLPFEVETWSPDAPAAIWIALPRIEPGRGARAWLYYGNPDAPAGADDTAVWDDGFAGVWHLQGLDDSTLHGNHAEDQGSVPASGVVGDARAFDTSGQRLVVAPSDSLADLPADGLTITVWVRPNTAGFVSGGRILDNADAAAASHGVSLLTSPTTLGLEFNRGAATSEGNWIDLDPIAYGRWQHVGLTYVDGEAPLCWVDGVPLAFEDVTAAVGELASDIGAPFGIGGAPYDTTHTFDGAIDELRISRGMRSEAWILAELRAASGELVTLGAEESAPP